VAYRNGQHVCCRPCYWKLSGDVQTPKSNINTFSSVTYLLRLIKFCFHLLMQIYAMPVFDMIETLLVKKLHFKPSMALRFISRNVYVGK
jgi:hypothetical protein